MQKGCRKGAEVSGRCSVDGGSEARRSKGRWANERKKRDQVDAVARRGLGNTSSKWTPLPARD